MSQPIHNDFMKRNILQNLFLDHYEEIQYTLHPRKTEMENIDKMLNCEDPAYGGAMYSQKRAQAMSFKLINCQHRHCVFTISKELRHYFYEDRELLNCLFEAASSVIQQMFYKMNKSQNFTPGYILVLHTFGRPLEWNSHIHCLISEGGIGDTGFWRKVNFFSFTYMRHAFQTALLNLMEKHIP